MNDNKNVFDTLKDTAKTHQANIFAAALMLAAATLFGNEYKTYLAEHPYRVLITGFSAMMICTGVATLCYCYFLGKERKELYRTIRRVREQRLALAKPILETQIVELKKKKERCDKLAAIRKAIGHEFAYFDPQYRGSGWSPQRESEKGVSKKRGPTILFEIHWYTELDDIRVSHLTPRCANEACEKYELSHEIHFADSVHTKCERCKATYSDRSPQEVCNSAADALRRKMKDSLILEGFH